VGYSKRQFITAALSEIGLADYVFDLQPQDLESGLRRLDSMMAEWNAKGIRLGYPIPGSPQFSDINLAIRLAPSYGKQVMAETKVDAKNAYNTLLSRATLPAEQQLPGSMPAGAGNKPWRVYDDPFLRPPIDPVLAGQDGPIQLY
jgi:hypothetical protein